MCLSVGYRKSGYVVNDKARFGVGVREKFPGLENRETWGTQLTLLPALFQAEGVHVAVLRADINYPIRHGGRRIHNVASSVAPQLDAGACIQRVDSIPGVLL